MRASLRSARKGLEGSLAAHGGAQVRVIFDDRQADRRVGTGVARPAAGGVLMQAAFGIGGQPGVQAPVSAFEDVTVVVLHRRHYTPRLRADQMQTTNLRWGRVGADARVADEVTDLVQRARQPERAAQCTRTRWNVRSAAAAI